MAVRRLILLSLLVAVDYGYGGSVAAASGGGASDFVRQLGDRAVAVLQSQNSSLEMREAQFRDILRTDFDLPLISKIVLGRHAKTATPEHLNNYQRDFSEFVLQTYSSRLGGYTGETLTIVSERPAGSKDTLVSTNIKRPAGPPIRADWRVRTSGDRYRIVDIMVEGISMVVTQRSEFSSVIQRNGLDGLIQLLRIRLDKMPAVAAAS